MAPKTMYSKIWDSHIVRELPDGLSIMYVDAHLVHEVTSPQAFEGLRVAGRKVRRPDLTYATMDHNVPTTDLPSSIADPVSVLQMETLERNCREFSVPLYGLDSPEQGIVHVIGPELGITQPGKTIVCGDSHTATHGAFGALAFGIGTSEVEHVLATQCLLQRRSRTFEIRVEGRLQPGLSAKDVILAIIGRTGTAGGTGMVVEYTGEVIRGFGMDERMTICNMSIELGARAGMIAPDDTTIEYLAGRRFCPSGRAFDEAAKQWLSLGTGDGASYDRLLTLDVSALVPQVTWGTSPGMVMDITGSIPDPSTLPSAEDRQAAIDALKYMDLVPGTPISAIPVDTVFIGSCTNGRLSDMREAAAVIKGRKVAPGVLALVVPGSKAVREAAEAEGLDVVFRQAGFEWRRPGCSMCLAMNPDVLRPGQRSASTSNRNFEGRQGKGGRTHLVSPATAAATAIAGHFADVRQLL